VVLSCSVASAQFEVRLLNITSEAVDDHTEALQFLDKNPISGSKGFSASFDGIGVGWSIS